MHYLDRNEFQFDLPPKCLDLIKESAAHLLSHYSRSFERHVKSPITERLAAIYGVPEENILLGYGCEDLLTQIVQHFVQKDDRVLVAQHAWWYYKKIADQVNGVTYEFPMHRTDRTFYIDIQDILSLHDKHHPKVVLLANPNNPTGDGFAIHDIETLITRCPDTLFVLDEAYWGYEGDGNAHVSKFFQNYPNAVILRTFSKFYGLAGVRIGFGFVHPQHHALIQGANRYLGFNRMSEELALAALDSHDHYLDVSKIVEQEKERYCSTLRSLPGVRVYDSKANFILISIPEKTVKPLKDGFQKAGIKVRFFDEKGLENHFRVSIGKPEVNDLVFQCIQDAVSRT
jgi:histidinol-phosphate aminotransferase